MGDDLVHIDGDLEERDRHRLVRLLRRVEAASDFDASVADELGAPWVVAIGWGMDDDGPVSVTRLMSGLAFSGEDIEAVLRQIERWLVKNGVES